MDKVGCDAHGPFLIQRQCDEVGPVLAISGCNIDSAGATSSPKTVDDQVQALRMAIDLGVVQRRPAGAGEVYWLVQFDAQALQGRTKTSGKAHLVRRRAGQFRVREVLKHEGLPMKSVYQQKPEHEEDVRRDDERKTRKCLMCRVEFSSEWAGERVCRNCKQRAEWRSG